MKGQKQIVGLLISLTRYALSLPGSSYVLIVQLRLDEVSPAVILSVPSGGDMRSRQIRAIVSGAEEHKPASNGPRAKMHRAQRL